MPRLLSATTARALVTPVETSLRQLLEEYELDQGSELLLSLRTLEECFDEHGLSCEPILGRGGLDDPRVVASHSGESIAHVLAEVARLETATVEFKSSLQIDRRRMAHDPGRGIDAYRSDAVLASALKTIAAFANSGGGTLYLGVEDDGTICGMAEDFQAASRRADFDGWEQHLRNLIRDRFSDGAALTAYVKTTCFIDGDTAFVQARVAPRQRLTFLKSGPAWDLYVRAGTQTNAIPNCDIEHHFVLTRLY